MIGSHSLITAYHSCMGCPGRRGSVPARIKRLGPQDLDEAAELHELFASSLARLVMLRPTDPVRFDRSMLV